MAGVPTCALPIFRLATQTIAQPCAQRRQLVQQVSGFRLNGFPTLRAWLSYGLGSESDNLPAFVVIPDARQLPPGGSINWSNGFLPARHQGVTVRAKGSPIDDLQPAKAMSAELERDS